jgi:hypothetical protein
LVHVNLNLDQIIDQFVIYSFKYEGFKG